jgi:hypothetical protein
MLRIIDLNEMAFTELVLSIDVSSSSGKIAFGIVKSCKTNDYEDGHAGLAWEKLRSKYDQYLLRHWLKLKDCSESVS